MAAVVTLVFVAVGVWTGLSFLAALAVGRSLRRLEPIPVRTRAPRYVDLRGDR
jgi:hypothetical protein